MMLSQLNWTSSGLGIVVLLYEKLDIAAANKDTLIASIVVMDHAYNIVYMMTRLVMTAVGIIIN